MIEKGSGPRTTCATLIGVDSSRMDGQTFLGPRGYSTEPVAGARYRTSLYKYMLVDCRAMKTLARVHHDHQVAAVFCGASALVRFVSRRRYATRPILDREVMGRVLTLCPSWVLQVPASGLLHQASQYCE